MTICMLTYILAKSVYRDELRDVLEKRIERN